MRFYKSLVFGKTEDFISEFREYRYWYRYSVLSQHHKRREGIRSPTLSLTSLLRDWGAGFKHERGVNVRGLTVTVPQCDAQAGNVTN